MCSNAHEIDAGGLCSPLPPAAKQPLGDNLNAKGSICLNTGGALFSPAKEAAFVTTILAKRDYDLVN